MKTAAVCTRDVIAARGDTTLTEAAKLMRENHVGSIVVLEPAPSRKPTGILTDRDIVVEVVAAGLDPRNISVGEIMSGKPATARECDDAFETLKSMRRCGVRRLPVVDAEGNLSGIVAMDDLFELAGRAMGDIAEVIASERSVERVRRP